MTRKICRIFGLVAVTPIFITLFLLPMLGAMLTMLVVAETLDLYQFTDLELLLPMSIVFVAQSLISYVVIASIFN
jgi:hypothetical protein